MGKEIRDILMDEIDSLLEGKTDIKRARVVCKLGAQVIYKDRIEIEKEVIVAKKKLWFGKDKK